MKEIIIMSLWGVILFVAGYFGIVKKNESDNHGALFGVVLGMGLGLLLIAIFKLYAYLVFGVPL